MNDPKEVFKEVAFHYLDDPARERKKIEFAELIEKHFKVVEKEFEELVALTTERQKNDYRKVIEGNRKTTESKKISLIFAENYKK